MGSTTRPIKDQTPYVDLPLKPSLPPPQAFARIMHSQDPSSQVKSWFKNLYDVFQASIINI